MVKVVKKLHIVYPQKFIHTKKKIYIPIKVFFFLRSMADGCINFRNVLVDVER